MNVENKIFLYKPLFWVPKESLVSMLGGRSSSEDDKMIGDIMEELRQTILAWGNSG